MTFAIDPEIVSPDIGNILAKLVGDGGVTETMPSMYAPLSSSSGAMPSRFEMIRCDGDTDYYVFGNRILEFGDVSRIEAYNDETRYWSKWYLRFVLYSVFLVYAQQDYDKERMAKRGLAPRIVISLPASVFGFKDKIDKVRRMLHGTHSLWAWAEVNGKMIEVKYKIVINADEGGNLIVKPEGNGAFARMLVEEEMYRGIGITRPDGTEVLTDFANQRVLVCAWGWLTLSVIGYDKGKPIKGLVNSHSRVGALQIAKAIMPYVGNPTELNMMELNHIIHSDSPEVNGIPYNIAEARRKIARSIANEGFSWAMREKNLQGVNFDAMLLVGGTAEFLFGPDQQNALVKYTDLQSADAIPGKVPFKAPCASNDDAYGNWLYLDYKRSRGI